MPPLFDVVDPLTLKLAPLVGCLLVFSALGVVRKQARAEAMLREIKASISIAHTTGVVAFTLGAGIILLHSDITSPTAILVTLTGIWWAIEGAALMAFTDLLPLKSDHMVRNYRMGQVIALFVGAFLIVAGLLGKASIIPG